MVAMSLEYPHLRDANPFPDVTTARPYAMPPLNDFDYSRWTPGTKITVCCVPWDAARNIVKFADDDARDAWFHAIDAHRETLQTEFHLLPDGTLKLPIPFATLSRYNYVYVEYPLPTSPADPLDYAATPRAHAWGFFMSDVTQLAANTTQCRLSLDAWTTFGNHIHINYCQLSRGHAPLHDSDVDAYLSNPIDNAALLLTPDVSYGPEAAITRDHVFIPWYSSRRVVMFATSIAPDMMAHLGQTAEWPSDAPAYPTYSDNPARWGHQYDVNGYDWNVGTKDMSDLDTPADTFASSDGVTPNGVHVYAIESERAKALFTAILDKTPQLMQTIKAIWVVPAEVVSKGTPVTIAGVGLYVCEAVNDLPDISVPLTRDMFDYPADYADLAKLYTFPYAALELSDNDGKTVAIRIENTGTIKLHRRIGIAYPYLKAQAFLTGVNGTGATTYEWRDLNGQPHTAQSYGTDWSELMASFDIPTFGLYVSGQTDWTLHNQVANTAAAKLRALNDYHIAMRSANTAYENAKDSANTGRANTGRSADTALANATTTANNGQTMANDSADTAYGNAIRSNTTARQNAAASNATAQANANASADTAQSNANASAATAKANADASALTAQQNANAAAYAGEQNAFASNATAQTNTNASADTMVTNMENSNQTNSDNVTATNNNSDIVTQTSVHKGAVYYNNANALSSSNTNSDIHLQLYAADVDNTVGAISAIPNAIGSAASGAAQGAEVGGPAGAALGAAVSGGAAIAGSVMAIVKQTLITQASAMITQQKQLNAQAYNQDQYNIDYDTAVGINDANKRTRTAIMGNNNALNKTNTENDANTTKDNATRTRDTGDGNATRSYNMAVANAARSYATATANNARAYQTAVNNAAASNATAHANSKRAFDTAEGNADRTKVTADANAAASRDVTKRNAQRSRDTSVNTATRTKGTTVDNADASLATELNNIQETREASEFGNKTRLEQAPALARLSYAQSRTSAPVFAGQYAGDPAPDMFAYRGVQVRVKTQSASAIRQAGDQFLRYGYRFEGNWDVTTLTVMPHFTYWEMSEVWFDADTDIMEEARQAIRALFENGVTVWADPNDIGKVGIHGNK